MTNRRLEVRSVNGDGPMCGCGRRSALHTVSANADIFLCAPCATAAAEAYIRATGQDDQLRPPGDYGRDLIERDHSHHRVPVRWCLKCERAARLATAELVAQHIEDEG